MGKNKMKTKKAAAKRFKVSSGGKVMHRQPGQRHLLSKKSSRRKRRLSQPKELKGQHARNIKRVLGEE